MLGDGRAERVAHDGADLAGEGLGGKLLRVAGESGTIVAIRSGAPRPDYRGSRAIRFWLRAPDATADAPLTVEVQLHSRDRRARFWHKVTLDEPAWRREEIPLRYFRHSGGFYLDWDEIERFGWYFRDAGTLELDGIEFPPAETPGETALRPVDLNRIAFAGNGGTHTSAHFTVVTDAEFEVAELLAELERLHGLVAADFPGVAARRERVPLLVFAREADYRAFWPAFAGKFRAEIAPPTSDGFAALGVAATWHDPAQGAVRPVMLHEATHGLLAREFGLANRSEWLHEGLASRYQLHWTRQDATALMKPRFLRGQATPLSRLCDGGPITLRDYSQAVLVVEWMLGDPARRRAFDAALAEMRKRGSTKMQALAPDCFGQDLAALERAWSDWLRARIEGRSVP